jgi:hypothetical protein
VFIVTRRAEAPDQKMEQIKQLHKSGGYARIKEGLTLSDTNPTADQISIFLHIYLYL